MTVEEINNSLIIYNMEDYGVIQGYYEHCISLVKESLLKNDLNVNVILGNYSPTINNTNRTIKIDIQSEHTLVKPGGRSVHEIVYGNVKCEDGTYLIRISNFDYFNNLDYVIEYSLANIHNISTNERFNNYLKKIIYVSATYYDIDFNKDLKTDIITMFIDNSNVRRNKILNDLTNLNIPFNKIENCFDSKNLNEIYKKTKILINVHQTDHHHTLEELRILPALMTGVLIVSERVPLTEVIPYGDYIIWSDYNDIAQTTLDVMNNYEYYYNKIFTNGNLIPILQNMIKDDETVFDKILTF